MKYLNQICKKHGLVPHRIVSEGAKGIRWRCCECYAEYHKKHRETVIKKIYDYKGRKCSKCGYDKCIEALDFHHLDETKKDFNISRKITSASWKRLKKELDKCILVCSNCHREIHAGLA